MKSFYQLRQATSIDLDFVTRLHRDTLREYLEPLFGWDQTFWADFIKNWFVPGRTQIIQASGIDVGLLVVENRETDVLFESISIEKFMQGHGIGSAVIQDIVNIASARRVPVLLDVLKTNVSARWLYERFGFKVTGETETDFQMRWSPSAAAGG